ncbi:MAG TPA: Stp1/IreP family PP2C-type Ser/Thr phosphatase [Thermoanaerobaculia bacterium]|jgi:protein phosphatase
MSEQASSDATPHRSLVVRAVLRTDVGLVRSENQDFGTYTTPSEEQDNHAAGRLLVVADGMGGHRGGATASRIAGETVKAQFLGSETTDVATALRESLIRANARIYSEAHSNPELRGMGTTTSALAVRGDHAWIAHVGDSRIYLVRDDTIRQLTEDHSLVATMVREGLLTPQEAEVHPRRNVLQRSMGVSDDVEIDVRGPFQLREGDTFILCSDGLHGLVKEQELKEIAHGTIEDAADEFLRRALERGAPDNVTVIVARVEHGEGEPVNLFDETLADTQKLVAVTDEALRDTDKIKVEPEPGSSGSSGSSAPSAEPLRGTPRNSEEPRGTRSPVPWLLLLLVLGAAGAWYYLSR